MWRDDLRDRNSPLSDSQNKLSNQYLATGPIRVYGVTVFSSNAAAQYVLMFDASSLPADTAVPLMTFQIATNGNLGLYYGPMGRVFKRGLVLCTSSTSTTKTLNATSDCFWDVEYDFLPVPSSASSPDSETA